MRNISFSMTTPQFIDRSKTVTRRNGWVNLKIGDKLMGVEKGMGLQKGEKVKRLGMIEVVSVRRELLNTMVVSQWYGKKEVVREGFPNMTPEEFVAMYCKHNKCQPTGLITRIEFRHVDGAPT